MRPGAAVPKSMAKRDYRDKEKSRKKREMIAKLSDILEYTADEKEAIRLWKSVEKQDQSADDLERFIQLFRECVREKRGFRR